jgi:hypothetical protein
MIVGGKAVKKECLSKFCQVLTLTATTADEARFLAFLHRITALGGGSIKVEDLIGNKASIVLPVNEGPNVSKSP